VLDRLRTKLNAYLGILGRWFARSGASPTSWTFVGVGFSVLAGLAYSKGGYWAGVLGGVLILVSGGFDLVDGAVARATGRVTKRGSFLDSTLDRLGEVAVFVGILVGGFANPLVVVLALSASLLVSYARAKGDSLGVALSGVGIGERSERLLIIAVSSLVGLLGWGLVVVATVAFYTFIERTVRGAKGLS
jgi:archaetidylinositol phosphate synthase